MKNGKIQKYAVYVKIKLFISDLLIIIQTCSLYSYFMNCAKAYKNGSYLSIASTGIVASTTTNHICIYIIFYL